VDRTDPIEKPSGGDVPRGPSSLDDLVDEASLESFPCSDPPTFTSLHAGMPVAPAVPVVPERSEGRDRPEGSDAQPVAAEDVTASRGRRAEALALAQGIFFATSGLWPVVHMRSFEAVTGRKRDRWLVRTVGLLIACIGGTLVVSARSRRVTKELMLLGASAPAALAAIDIVYAAKGTIRKVYLLDAVVELGLFAGWLGVMRGRPRSSRRETSSPLGQSRTSM